MTIINRDGEYNTKGDYHKELDKKWKYYPIYLAKMDYLTKFLSKIPKDRKILDAGCGEGVLVNLYRQKGYDIQGLDLNYSSQYVTKGNILNAPFESGSFDVILCLDVIEHISLTEQERALTEIYRLLSDNGIVLLAIPNLAHFLSRLSFTLTGRLIRTSSVERHQGDRPISEYMQILEKNEFIIVSRKGIFPTYPISSLMTYLFPDKVIWLHKFLNRVLAYSNWCFLNMVICKKKH